jgi:large subunit ribosomal protein L6
MKTLNIKNLTDVNKNLITRSAPTGGEEDLTGTVPLKGKVKLSVNVSKEGCAFSLRSINKNLGTKSIKEESHKKLTITGPLGSQSIIIPNLLNIEIDNMPQRGNVEISPAPCSANPSSKLINLNASLIKQMIQGVTEGFKKQIKLIGIGYKIKPSCVDKINYLTLNIGFSHPVTIKVPSNINISELAIKENQTDPSSIVLNSTSLISLNNFVTSILSIRPVTKSFKGTGISINNP